MYESLQPIGMDGCILKQGLIVEVPVSCVQLAVRDLKYMCVCSMVPNLCIVRQSLCSFLSLLNWKCGLCDSSAWKVCGNSGVSFHHSHFAVVLILYRYD